MVRHRVDDGFEIGAHPIAWRRGRVMLARTEAGEIWSRGGPGGNPDRRNPVVGIVEGGEPHVLSRVPEPFQFPMPCLSGERVQRRRRRGTYGPIRKPDPILHELERPAEGVAQFDVCTSNVRGPRPLQRFTKTSCRAIDSTLQVLIAAMGRWINAHGAFGRAASRRHGKPPHVSFRRQDHHGSWMIGIHEARPDDSWRINCRRSATGRWWERVSLRGSLGSQQRRLPTTGNGGR